MRHDDDAYSLVSDWSLITGVSCVTLYETLSSHDPHPHFELELKLIRKCCFMISKELISNHKR